MTDQSSSPDSQKEMPQAVKLGLVERIADVLINHQRISAAGCYCKENLPWASSHSLHVANKLIALLPELRQPTAPGAIWDAAVEACKEEVRMSFVPEKDTVLETLLREHILVSIELLKGRCPDVLVPGGASDGKS